VHQAQLVRFMEVAAFHPRLYTLRQFGLVDFKVHSAPSHSSNQTPPTFTTVWAHLRFH
jgi:hypothetical protein